MGGCCGLCAETIRICCCCSDNVEYHVLNTTERVPEKTTGISSNVKTPVRFGFLPYVPGGMTITTTNQ